jgi:predicted ATPase
MIRRLQIHGYKSLHDATLELGAVSVILGPNAAGKSNLLDLLGLLSELASRETVREAFKGHRGRPLEAFYSPSGFGKAIYEDLLQKPRLSFRVACDLDLHPQIVETVNSELARREEAVGTSVTYTKVTETTLRYEVEIAMHPQSGELFVADESLRALKRDLEPKADSVRKPFFERERVSEDKYRFVARIERQAHPRYFEPDRPRTLLSELSDPVYHPHVVAAAREIASWRVYYVEPARMRAEVGVQAAQEPGRSGELLACYYYYLQQREPATLRGIIDNLKDLVPGLEGLRVDVRDGLLEIVAIFPGGAEFPSRLLSEGTLRLLCILGIAVAPSPPAVVVYEEPENGVNPSRLDLIAQMVRNSAQVRPDGPQFILTTHSPLVCATLPEHLVLCTWDHAGGTQFKLFPWKPDTLWFEHDVIEALDGLLGKSKRK